MCILGDYSIVERSRRFIIGAGEVSWRLAIFLLIGAVALLSEVMRQRGERGRVEKRRLCRV